MSFIVSSDIYKELLNIPEFVRFDPVPNSKGYLGDGRKRGILANTDILVDPTKPNNYIEVNP